MDLDIKTIYSYIKPNGEKAFLYSVMQSNSPLHYSYYTLDINEHQLPIIRQVNNTIYMLQSNSIHLTPITTNSDDYKTFISSLTTAYKNYLPLRNTINKTYKKTPFLRASISNKKQDRLN